MTTPSNEQIAASLDLWNEYYNASAFMTDEEFEAMAYEDRLEMLNRDYPDAKA
jgi:hypothetical protein